VFWWVTYYSRAFQMMVEAGTCIMQTLAEATNVIAKGSTAVNEYACSLRRLILKVIRSNS
jgi:hypothetical protein